MIKWQYATCCEKSLLHKVDHVLKDGTISHVPRAVSDAECGCDNRNEYKCVAKTPTPVCGIARAETENIAHSKQEGFQTSGGVLSRRKQQRNEGRSINLVSKC